MEVKNDLLVEEYNELVKSVGWKSKNENIVKKAIESSSVVKKVVIENRTIAMGRAIGDGMSYLISDVVVNPKYQGKGLGKIVMREILKEIRLLTCENQECSVNLISINGKEEFYEKCGFTKVPYDYNGYGMKLKIVK